MTQRICRVCGFPLDNPRDISHYRICEPRSKWPEWLVALRPTTVAEALSEVNEGVSGVLGSMSDMPGHFSAGPEFSRPEFDSPVQENTTEEAAEMIKRGVSTLLTVTAQAPAEPHPERLVRTVTELVACDRDGCDYVAQSQRYLAVHRAKAKIHTRVGAA